MLKTTLAEGGITAQVDRIYDGSVRLFLDVNPLEDDDRDHPPSTGVPAALAWAANLLAQDDGAGPLTANVVELLGECQRLSQIVINARTHGVGVILASDEARALAAALTHYANEADRR